MSNLDAIIDAVGKEKAEQLYVANANTAKYQEMSKRVNDEVAAHAATTKQLRAVTAERDQLKQKVETMANHPDVLAAALKKAQENKRQADANVAQLEAKVAAENKTVPQVAPVVVVDAAKK